MLSRPTRIAFWADPNYCIMVSALGLVMLGFGSLPFIWTNPVAMLESLLVGLAIGLPAILWYKWLKRTHIDDYARAAVDPEFASEHHWRFVTHNLPVGLSPIVILAVQLVVGLSIRPGFLMALPLFFLTYPEDRDIANLARAKLGQP